MNSINLIGNLTREPELKYLPGGDKAVCNFTLAVTRPMKSDVTDFINIVVFGKIAENCSTYLKKGSKAGVTGYLTIRKWQTKENENRYSTEVIANTVEFLTPKGTDSLGGNDYEDMVPVDENPDDLPF